MENILKELKNKISQHRDHYNRNEYAVRRQLIEPILDYLNWKTDNPALVQLNSQTDDRDIPDYTLFRENRIETFIEAKNLSANISDHIQQLARYCINQGIEFGVLTNGSDWLLIKTFEKGTKLRDRIIWQVSLEKDTISNIQSRLSTISYEQITQLPELIEKEKRLEKFLSEYIAEEDKILDKLSTEIANDFLTKFPDEDYDKETITNFFKSGLWSFLHDKTPYMNEHINDDENNFQSKKNKEQKNNYNIFGLKKAKTPSARDWIERVPELRGVTGLNSWRDICEHLKISVEGDSARRRLKRWIETYKPNWPNIPEPKSNIN